MFQSPTSFKNVQQLYYQNWFNTSKDTCQFDFLKILMHRSTLFSLQNFHYIFLKINHQRSIFPAIYLGEIYSNVNQTELLIYCMHGELV